MDSFLEMLKEVEHNNLYKDLTLDEYLLRISLYCFLKRLFLYLLQGIYLSL